MIFAFTPGRIFVFANKNVSVRTMIDMFVPCCFINFPIPHLPLIPRTPIGNIRMRLG